MADLMQTRGSNFHPYSKAKANKHLTERRRRARINDSLLQLKTMVFPSVQDEFANGSKMEKADILEMTLKYVKDVQKQCQEGVKPSVDQYQAGFSDCLGEVSRFLSSCRAVDLDTRMQLLNHLANRCTTRPPTPEPAVSSTTSLPRQCHDRVPKLHSESNVFVVQSLETPTLRLVTPSPKASPVSVTPCYTVSPVSFPTLGSLKVSVGADSSALLTPPSSPVTQAVSPRPGHPQTVLLSPTYWSEACPDVKSKSLDKSVWRPW